MNTDEPDDLPFNEYEDDDDLEDDYEELKPLLNEQQQDRISMSSFYGIGAKEIVELQKKASRRRKGKQIPSNIERMLGEANELFSFGDMESAESILKEINAQNYDIPSSFITLSAIAEQRGNYSLTAHYLEKAASIAGKSELWKSAGFAYLKINELDSALHCFSKAIRTNPTEVACLYERALIHIKQGANRRAASDLMNCIKRDPTQLSFYKDLARVYHSLNETPHVIAALQKGYEVMANSLDATTSSLTTNKKIEKIPLDFDLLNMYADQLMDEAEWEKVLQVIDFADRKRGMMPLPLQLTVKHAICKIYTGNISAAQPQLKHLYQQSPQDWAELYRDVIGCMKVCGEYREALNFLERLKTVPECDNPSTWIQMAECYKQLDSYDMAINYYEKSFKYDKTNVEVCLALSALYNERGMLDKGIQIVDEHEKETKALHNIEKDQFSQYSKEPIESQQEQSSSSEMSHAPGTSLLPSQLLPPGMLDAKYYAELEHARLQRELESQRGPASMDFSRSVRGDIQDVEASLEASAKQSQSQKNIILKLQATIAEKESKMLVVLQKSRLFYARHDYQRFVETLTPILTDPEILFYRSKRRTKSTKPPPAALVVPAPKRRKTKGKKSAAPVPELISFGGISSVNTKSASSTSQVEEYIEDEDFEMDNGEEEEEELFEEIESTSEQTKRGRGKRTASVTPSSTKKRKREEISRPSVLLNDTDPSKSSDLGLAVSRVAGSNRWEIPDETRVLEMKYRKNIWELCGMTVLINLVIDYCKSLIYIGQVDSHHYSIVETLYILVAEETEFLTEPMELRTELRYTIARVSYAAGMCAHAAKLMRQVCLMFPNNQTFWNFFFKSASRTREFYISRSFTMKLADKYPDNLSVALLRGHMYQMAGSHPMAISCYLKALQQDPSNPSILLCTAVAFLNRSMSRVNPNRHSAVMKAFAFMYRYFIEQVWGCGACPHEAYYNMARAFHHLSLYNYAIPLYEYILNDTTVPVVEVVENPDLQLVGNLKREAAYNLALIYRSSGAHHLARKYLQDYLTI